MKLPESLIQNLSFEDAVKVETDDDMCVPQGALCAHCKNSIDSSTCFWIVYHGLPPEVIDAYCCDARCLRGFLSGLSFICFDWN